MGRGRERLGYGVGQARGEEGEGKGTKAWIWLVACESGEEEGIEGMVDAVGIIWVWGGD